MPLTADPTIRAEPAQGSGKDNVSLGLTSDEARARLVKYGPNAMPDTAIQPWRRALAKFWAPVPWMLEAAVILQIVLHEYVEAAVIAGLLVFNATLGFFQEGHAQATLAALKSRLALTASVKRDGVWRTIPAPELAPGDVVKLSLGGVVAADVKLVEGSILLDQSMLTGESVPTEAGPGLQTYAGALVRRGEATAIVTATGARGLDILRNSSAPPMSRAPSKNRHARGAKSCHLQWRNRRLAGGDARNMPIGEIIPLILTAVLASIPVALPATFTFAAALGAKALARLGVLPTRSSAVDEAATLEVLCSD
jgi:H+-transporting ATPase